MFLPKKLNKVVIIIPKKYTNDLIKSLGNLRSVEIKEFEEEYSNLPSVERSDVRTHEIVKSIMKLDYMIEKLNIEKAEPGNECESPIQKSEELVTLIDNKYSDFEKKIDENKIRIEDIETTLEFLGQVKKIKLKKKGSPFLFESEDTIWDDLSKQLKKNNITYSKLQKRISGNKILRILTIKENKKEHMSKVLDRFSIRFYTGGIKKIETTLKNQLSSVKNDLKKLEKKLEKLPNKYATPLFALREQLQLELSMLNNRRKFLSSEFTTLINLWVAITDYKKLKEKVKKITRGNYVIYKEEAKLDDNPPTQLSNFFLFRPFEMLVEQFSLPGYRDIDPTFIIALVFPIFFGIMLSDAGYGVLLTLLSLFIMIKNKKNRGFGQILLLCGISTICAGLYFGSWFGYGLTKAYMDPLKRPIELMGISLAIGAIYVNLSLLIGLVQSIFKKNWKFLFYDIFVWFILETGIFFLIFPDVMRQYSSFPLHIIFIVGAIAIRVLSKGPLNILDFPKFFSTIISFIRLSALAMSTAWISFAINLIYQLVAQFPKGVYAGIIVLIAGHTFNFAFNTFGSFLQAMRLHYVEFLGQFYQGKGRKMEIFTLDREYTINKLVR